MLRGHTVFVSWNGATQVVRWQVLDGSRSIAVTVKRGFESAIPVGASTRGLVVRAIDADGGVLGSTAVRS